MDGGRAPRDLPAATGATKAPSRFRAFVRGNEIALVLLAALVGILAGVVVTLIGRAAQALHTICSKINLDTPDVTVDAPDGTN